MKLLQLINLNFEPGFYLRNDRYVSHDFKYPALSMFVFPLFPKLENPKNLQNLQQKTFKDFFDVFDLTFSM